MDNKDFALLESEIKDEKFCNKDGLDTLAKLTEEEESRFLFNSECFKRTFVIEPVVSLNGTESISTQSHSKKQLSERTICNNSENAPQYSSKTIPYKKNKANHQCPHTGEKPLTCNTYNFRMALKARLNSHNEIHNGIKPFSCSLCNYKTDRKRYMKRHISRHTDGNKQFVCNFCGYNTIWKSAAKRHIQTHTGDKISTACDDRAVNASNLRERMNLHTDEKPISCNWCSFRTTRNAKLASHVMAFHNNKKPLDERSKLLPRHSDTYFSCNMCDYKTRYELLLKKHASTHSGNKSFSCTLCNFTSFRKDTLKKHLRVHTRMAKPFTCRVCDYRAALESNLKAHVLEHTGEKPFICSLCAYRSLTEHDLKEHAVIHEGGKSMCCCVCDYLATSKEQLTAHMNFHIDESFSEKTRLKVRSRSVSSVEKTFRCSLCDYQTSQSSILKQHILCTHFI